MIVVHELKTWPIPFSAVYAGLKTYEVRRDDRGYAVGDLLFLREWDPETNDYSGRCLTARVTYMTSGGQFGLPKDVCVMSIVIVVRDRYA